MGGAEFCIQGSASPALEIDRSRFKLSMKEVQVMKKQTFYNAVIASLVLLLISVMGSPANASNYGHSGSPEFLYYMEGTGAYFLPDSDADIFFSLGKWYRRSGSSWSASVALSGPWGALSVSSVPTILVNLPAGFRATYHLGQVPYRYVVDSRKGHDNYGSRYYSGEYYNDYGSRGYQRHRHSTGGFWFFIAPDFHHDDRNDRHDRDDDWDDDRDDRDDDSHRRRRRGKD